jgi:hypothetical protein
MKMIRIIAQGAILIALLINVHRALAQCTFSSNSSGTDGDFNPPSSMPTNSGWGVSNDVATGNTIVTLTNQSNGIFNFKGVYIETNYVVKFTRNTLNTPVFLLAQSNVTIRGTIDVRGGLPGSVNGGVGGPGGFDGGISGSDPGSPGYGPGGGAVCTFCGAAGYATAGYQSDGTNGIAYGVLDILPMIGGSGGGGSKTASFGGGGGGGAILIASSGTLSCSGTINADSINTGGLEQNASGGSIRLIANTIQGEGTIHAFGANTAGRIRIEACSNLRSTLTYPMATYGPPGVVFLATNPTIRVTSIAGTNTPAIPTGSLTVADIYLATNFVNPAVISVSASNINPGTVFKIYLRPSYGTNCVATNTLAGTYAFSTGVVTMAVYTDRVWRVNAMIDYIPRP